MLVRLPLCYMGVSENEGYIILGSLRILLFRVLYYGPLFLETPISHRYDRYEGDSGVLVRRLHKRLLG